MGLRWSGFPASVCSGEFRGSCHSTVVAAVAQVRLIRSSDKRDYGIVVRGVV